MGKRAQTTGVVPDEKKEKENHQTDSPNSTKPFTILGEVVFEGDGKVTHKETKVSD